MITEDPKSFLSLIPAAVPGPTTLRQAMLIGPEGFQISHESASDNFYMNTRQTVNMDRALEQHHQVVATIEALGVPVRRFSGRAGLDDGMYPNNAFATADRKLILGRMLHPVRQTETGRSDIIDWFRSEHGYQTTDLSQTEAPAELTGSLIIDHQKKTGFCGLSTRTVAAGARRMHEAFGLSRTLMFDLAEGEYHTNLIMTILAGTCCLLYPPAIQDKKAVQAIGSYFGDRCIHISQFEKDNFVANSLALTKSDMIMSQRAADAMSASTINALSACGFRVHAVDISELEKGGGSMRCLIMEIF